MTTSEFRIGTAGWSIPRAVVERFPTDGDSLQRYAARFNCVEINSTFYKPHRPATFERWAATTPADFRFAVKAPKTITHERRLKDAADLLSRFLAETDALGDKRGPVLIQLPGTLKFDPPIAADFLADLRRLYSGEAVLEPRHPTWFTRDVDALLAQASIARVAADPAVVPEAARSGGWPGLRYWRLHGSPHLYATPYGSGELKALASALTGNPTQAWCIFDNTMSGAAAANALDLLERVRR